VAPELAAGRWVLLDRYIDSSLAYQGAGRGLGVEAVRAINEFATGGLTADRTLLLAIEAAAGRRRRGDRGEDADRLERETDEFFTRIAAGYASLAAAQPRRIRTLDATLAPDALLEAALAELADLLE
jgi:dTMP kinase